LAFSINRQGRQAIYNRADGKEYYLPKTRTVPRHYYESHRARALNKPQSSWEGRRLKQFCVTPDNLELTFKRVGDGKFELVGKAPTEMIERKRVDLMGKKAFKPYTNELYTWVTTMYPLMRDQLSWQLRNDVEQQAADVAKEHGIKDYKRSYNSPLQNCEGELMRKIILNKEHVLRYPLGVAAMFAFHEGYMEGDTKEGRAAYTRWVNKALGFNMIVKEEKK
jgi:hypothetical protein